LEPRWGVKLIKGGEQGDKLHEEGKGDREGDHTRVFLRGEPRKGQQENFLTQHKVELDECFKRVRGGKLGGVVAPLSQGFINTIVCHPQEIQR